VSQANLTVKMPDPKAGEPESPATNLVLVELVQQGLTWFGFSKVGNKTTATIFITVSTTGLFLLIM
jgi:hypothetical protein